MKLLDTIWYDMNSEPPKNYLWLKNDGFYQYSTSSKQWEHAEMEGCNNTSDIALRMIKKDYTITIDVLDKNWNFKNQMSIAPERLITDENALYHEIDLNTGSIKGEVIVFDPEHATEDIPMPVPITEENIEYVDLDLRSHLGVYKSEDVEQLIEFINLNKINGYTVRYIYQNNTFYISSVSENENASIISMTSANSYDYEVAITPHEDPLYTIISSPIEIEIVGPAA